MLVLTERKTRYEIVMKIASKNAESVVNALGKLKRRYRKRFKKVFLSITVDNGCEFSDYDSMKVFAPIYYCHPYSSWERGSNENANSIIRRWIPKGADMNKVTVKQVQFVENWINNYPRKVIGTTSQKAFNTELEQLQ
ncbi:MAG: IS30 family transposase [Ruthenibacterium sp.]